MPSLRLVDSSMHELPDGGGFVLHPHTVEVDEGPLASAVGVVLDLAERDDVAVVLGQHRQVS
jgi:hypothetical protein